MVSVGDADEILKGHVTDFGTETVDFDKAAGRILRESVFTDTDMPPFDRVSMDGIAIAYDAYQKGIRTFSIENICNAGAVQSTLSNPSHCIEVMTGAVCPLKADTIIPYEWIEIKNTTATIFRGDVRQGQNVHRRGTDRKEGDRLLTPGKKISPVDISILAAVGKIKVQTSRSPRIMVISTGNELVDVADHPQPHQLRRSNAPMIRAALREMMIEADDLHLPDELDAIQTTFNTVIGQYDVIIISGGVSAGKFDFIPAALKEAGAVNHFYKISQRPGKPFWFGSHPSGATIFAIPGNPVSSWLCYVRYIRPWIHSCMQQLNSTPVYASLTEEISFSPLLTYFLPVSIRQSPQGNQEATPQKGKGSGDFVNLSLADAFIELPADKETFLKGETYPVYFF